MGGRGKLTKHSNDPIESAQPHQIYQDHKYQTRALFDKCDKEIPIAHGVASPAPPPYPTFSCPSNVYIGNQTPRKRRDIICCAGNEIHICNGTVPLFWILVILLIIVLAAIIVPVVVIKLPKK
jgi:hypothetical protein